METATPSGPRLACGVAGWSYDDWKDTVYRLNTPPRQPSLFADDLGAEPAGRPKYADDPLAYLSGFVDMIEINSSFYRIPAPRATTSWARRTAEHEDFFFTAKLHQDFTHRGSRDRSLAATFREAFEPLNQAAKLKALLAQFRYDMSDSDDARRHLVWLRDQFASFAPLVVEVRHASWQQPGAQEFLRQLGVSVAILDYPTARDSYRSKDPVGSADAYFRLHGRNYDKWFASEKAPHEPYNYDYSDSEIDDLAETAEGLLPAVRSLSIVANNHYRGKGVSAALRLKSKLLQQQVAIPPALLEAYPNLKRIAKSSSSQ